MILTCALAAGATTALAQQSVYNSDFLNADYSGLTGTGGTIIVPLVLTSGPGVAGLGSSFNVTFTVSAITSYYSPGLHQWDVPNGVPAINAYGYGYPTNLYSALPPSNQVPLDVTINGVTYNGNNGIDWSNAQLTAGNLNYIGAFTISAGALPTVVGYSVVDELVAYGAGWQLYQDGDLITSGMYANTDDFTTLFGESAFFEFLAFNSEIPIEPSLLFPVWGGISAVTFEVIPEPGSISLLVAAGAFALIARKRLRKLS